MRILLQVLLRAVAAAFYGHYAGWLIAGGLLLGGVLSNNEHVALIREAVGDTRVLAGVYLLPWLLYAAISARFAFRLWAQPTYAPLLALRLVPPGRRWAVGLLTQAAVLAPCWGYGVVVAVFAAQAGASRALLLTLGWLAGLTTAGWGAHETALRRAGASAVLAGWRPVRHLRWPPALWGLRAELYARPLGTVLLKMASVGIVWGICRVYSPATFDTRLLALGALLTAALSLRLPAEVVAWERSRLAFRQNLPISAARRWGQAALLYGACLLPEAVAWARWYPLPTTGRWLAVARLTAFPWAALLLAGASLLRWPRRPAEFLPRALAGAFGAYGLLLTGAPIDALTVLAGLGSAWLTARYWWRADEAPSTES